MSKLLTLKEIAIELNVPESTVRKYREIFERFIPSVGTGRNRRYRSDAVAVFQDIRNLREDQQMPWETIADKLAEKYPIDATPEEPPRQTPLFAPEPRQPEHVNSQPREPVKYEPEHAARSIQQSSIQKPAQFGGGDEFAKKVSALSERQTMLVNAMAIELLRAVDGARTDNTAQVARLRGEYHKLTAAMMRTLGDANFEQKTILLNINQRIKTLASRLDAVEKPAAKEDDTKGRIATLEQQLGMLVKKIEQRDRLINEYKMALDALKEENSELKKMKQRFASLQEEKVSDWKKPQSAPHVEAPRPPQKKSLLNKIFGSK